VETLVNPAPSEFWRDRRVLLTGHTGFKGSWLALWLGRLGARVSGFALAPATQPSLYLLARVADTLDSRIGDVRDADAVAAAVRAADPEVVFHLAAQPLVRASYRQPLQTFDTNVMGTVHLLDALRGMSRVRSVVVVTTDKVYRNREWHYPYREDDALGGHDPYSASKAAAEIVVASYRDSFLREQGVALASARAGNVIGGGDWSEDRLIPDAVRAWQAGHRLAIRHPHAIRPWQHVLDPLAGYLQLARQLWSEPALAGAFNLGPATHEAATVGDVIELARHAYGHGAWAAADAPDGPHEAGWLALEVAQARARLGVTPRWGLADAVQRTMQWYRRLADGEDASALCATDIAAYESAR
jgi:CDP-glucose 4,6-dehydratase